MLLYSTALHLGKAALLTTGITHGFDRTYFSVDLGHPKTVPYGFTSLLIHEHMLAGSPGAPTDFARSFVFADDDGTNCQNAEEAKMKAVQLATPEGHSRDMSPADFTRPWCYSVPELADALLG